MLGKLKSIIVDVVLPMIADEVKVGKLVIPEIKPIKEIKQVKQEDIIPENKDEDKDDDDDKHVSISEESDASAVDLSAAEDKPDPEPTMEKQTSSLLPPIMTRKTLVN